MNEDRFVRVGIRPEKEEPVLPGRAGRRKEFPFLSAGILSFIFLGCLLFPLFIQTDPAYLDLAHAHKIRAAESLHMPRSRRKYIYMETYARAWPTHPSLCNGGEIRAETTPLLAISPYQTWWFCVCSKAWSLLDSQACLWDACGPG